MDMENFCLKSCGQIERMLFASRLQVPFVEFRQVICFEEHILCHALSVRCGTLPMFSFGISSVWLLSERVSMLTKLLRVSSMLGNILILRMTYRSELVSDGYTSIARGRNRTRNVTRYAKAFKDRGSLELTVLYARERNVPKGRKPLDWKLITNMPVRSRQQAIEKLDWYAMRWKIETFHKVLKSGCKAEEALLRTADRLQPDCDLLHSDLAHSLADDVQSHQSGRRARAGLHGNRDAGAGREDIEYGQDQGHAPFSGALCDHACASGRVYRAAQRPPAREQGDLARDGPIDGHCVRCDACRTRCG